MTLTFFSLGSEADEQEGMKWLGKCNNHNRARNTWATPDLQGLCSFAQRWYWIDLGHWMREYQQGKGASWVESLLFTFQRKVNALLTSSHTMERATAKECQGAGLSRGVTWTLSYLKRLLIEAYRAMCVWISFFFTHNWHNEIVTQAETGPNLDTEGMIWELGLLKFTILRAMNCFCISTIPFKTANQSKPSSSLANKLHIGNSTGCNGEEETSNASEIKY